jgi:hypothetical protein
MLIQFASPPGGGVVPIHLAFLGDDATFEHLLARIEALGLEHWADPRRSARRSPAPTRTNR